jgi:hypothetical protein
MPKFGFAALLSLFYYTPIGVLAAIGLAVAIWEPIQDERAWSYWLLGVALVPAFLCATVGVIGHRERYTFKRHAALFGDEFAKLFQPPELWRADVK